MGRLEGRGHGAEVTPRPAVPVAGVGDHDQVGLDRSQRGVVQAETGHHARGEILQHYVADRHQLLEDALSLLGAQVEGQAALAPVQGLECPTLLPPKLAGLVVGKRAGYCPSGLHELGLTGVDLDHLGTQVGQVRSGEGHGKNAAQVDDADVLQWRTAHITPAYLRAANSSPPRPSSPP